MRIFTIFVFLLAFTISGFAQTSFSGTISTNTIWDLAGSPYTITGNVTLNHDDTLTIEPNVVVYFTNGTGMYIYGALYAENVTFTSDDDTVGGSPLKGDWNFIQVGSSGGNYGVVDLNNCSVKYGGNNSTYGMIRAYQGELNLTSCDISNSKYDGITISYQTKVKLKNTSIFNTQWPVNYVSSGKLIFNGINNLTGNTYNGIVTTFYSTNTSMVLDTVDVPYMIRYNLTVSSDDTLTISSGAIVKLYSGTGLFIDGAFRAVAGLGENIYFTAFTDDNIGGDTNGDGTATSPATRYWRTIKFNNSSDDSYSEMDRCIISFSGSSYEGGVTTQTANPVIQNCQFSNNYYGAMLQANSNPVFSNNDIGSSQKVPIALSFDSYPVFNNNSLSFSDNEYDAIGILDGTLTADAILPIRSVTGIPNITYVLLGSVTVPQGMTLTINKGIVIKSLSSSHRIQVEGKLIADATADSAIVMTSVKDDVYGNPLDTNRDGTLSSPSSGDWSGIIFEDTADSNSVLDYVKINFARLSSTYRYSQYISGGAVTFVNSKGTVSNCELKDTDHGVYMYKTAHPQILNNSIVNTAKTPFALSVSSDPTFSGNTFTNASWTALGLIGESVGANGTIKKRTVGGFSNITYLVMADITINSGTYIDVEQGVVLKFYSSSGIYVNGGFKADGGVNGPIVFTSLKDDNYGNPGDTNGDASASSPSANDWETIKYNSSADDSYTLLDSVWVLFGGGSANGCVSFQDASGTVSNAVLSDNYYYGMRFDGVSMPMVSNVDIKNCRLDPIAMSLKSNPTFTDITFTANGSQGIKVLEGTLSSDATIFQRNIAGITNISYIIDNLTISSNAILTIEPGVVIKFTYYYSQIDVQGALIADGTPSERIVFTSIKDDSWGGDTNNDGNLSTAAKGDWYSVLYQSSGSDSLNVLNHTVFSYGGSAYYSSNYKQYGEVRISDSFVDIKNSVFEQSNSSGIGIFGSSNPTIDNCEIINIRYTPIAMSLFSKPVFSNNTSLNLGYAAIGIVPENYSLTDTVEARDFGGYTNMTYYLYGECKVNSGTVLTIPKCIVFKYGAHSIGRLTVEGGLIVNGTTANPVVFTDYRDDMYGNPMDTNGDGTATSPSIATSYDAILFKDVSEDANSHIDNAVIRYRGNAIRLEQASPTITNSYFDINRWGIRLEGVSKPVVLNNTFNDLTYSPMIISLVSYPATASGNQITGSTYRTIAILSETLAQDVELPQRDFGGITNIPYHMTGDYTVGTSVILTIKPGVIIKFDPYTQINVKKGLLAQGGSTPDSLIVFTDIRDDFYGGDSNADSNATSPAYSSGWSGLFFEDESLDPLCQISYAVIKYAGRYTDEGAIVTTSASPSIMYSQLSKNRNGLVAKAASNPIINYSDIFDNNDYGVKNVNQSFVINAQWNWWGTDNGPTHSGNPGGTGDAVTDAVDYGNYQTSGALNPLMGDVSLNGKVQAFDASLVLQNTVGSITLNPRQQQVADVSGTMGITAYDASLILQYTVGLINVFPAELDKDGQNVDESTLNYLALQKAGESSLMLEDVATRHGEQLIIPVVLNNSGGLTSLQAEFRFDPAMFEFESVIGSEKMSGLNMAYHLDEESHSLKIAFASSDMIEANGEIAQLVFKVKDDIKGDKQSIIEISGFYANETELTELSKPANVEVKGLPEKFALYQNYPNPFNPVTTIKYQVPEANTNIRIDVYNIRGQLIKTLVNNSQQPGEYEVTWNGTNSHGNMVASGLYIYRMQAGDFVSIKKFQLLK